ncbi:MAG: methyl-accepting chemotaxis protein [Lachnospiraceae bacterium]|nr:methyl-accepting chemotaxis protein [Lachnospiraceae bacterium]
MKKQTRNFFHSLTFKIIAIALVPLCVLACVLTIMSVDSVKKGIQEEMISKLQATVISLHGALDSWNEGSYSLDSNQDLYKGDKQITEKILEDMVDGTDMDVTVFYDKTRRATTLKDKKTGQYILGTDAADEVYDQVVRNGKDMASYDLTINEEQYYAYYMPLKDAGGTTVGMLFAGAPATDVNAYITQKTTYLVVVTLVIALLALVTVGVCVFSIRGGLKSANGALNSLAQGELHIELSPRVLKRGDELGEIARSVQLLEGELGQIVQKLLNASDRVLHAGNELSTMSSQTSNNAEEIGRAVGDIASGATAQAEDIETATMRMNTLGGLIEDMTRNAGKLAVTSDEMDRSRESAEQIISELSDSNTATVDAAGRMDRQIHITNEAAERIQKAIQIITSIADETNLLSLNASIEAARAGEQGKGFAVVATQIQTLAEQSGASAKEIEEITQELLQESAQAVEIMEEMQSIVVEEAEKLDATKKQFSEVSKGITETRKESGNIQNKTEECDAVRQEMMDIISNLSAVSEENAASTQETTASMQVFNETILTQSESANNLSELSRMMDQELEFFHI